MKILIINPNSSSVVTDSINNEANNFRNDNLLIDVVNSETGSKAIETNYDEIVAASFVTDKFKKVEKKYDAGIIGCYSDPGLNAAREVVNMPIVGIGEASFYTACLYGGRFSIIASGKEGDISVFYEIVRKYGLESRLASVRYLSLGIEEINKSKEALVEEHIKKCIYDDGANVIILGCGAFAGFGSELTKKIGIPVLDGIKESIAFAKMMIENNY